MGGRLIAARVWTASGEGGARVVPPGFPYRWASGGGGGDRAAVADRLRLAGEEVLFHDGVHAPVAVDHLRDAVVHRHRHQRDRLVLGEAARGHEEVAHLAEGIPHGEI